MFRTVPASGETSPGSGGRAALPAVVLLAVALLAAVRVAALAAALPFYVHVDEHKHVDMALKYARGYLPGDDDRFEPETGTWLGLYGSPEYLLRPGVEPPPPSWARGGRMLEDVRRSESYLEIPNKEAHQPPVYYALGGAWLGAGRAAGLEGARLLYLVRGLGALLAFGLVLATGLLLRDLYPARRLVWLGAPVLLALFPQDALLYVTPDALSPLLGALVFGLAVRIAVRPESGTGVYAACGLLGAAAILTKYTNVALLGACVASSFWAARTGGAAARRRLVALWGLLAGPVALWLGRNQLVLGEPTGGALKAQRLGWEPQPPGEWLDHPVFSPSGAWEFAVQLVETFWRGELVWHRQVLAHASADGVYLATTLLFVALAAGAALRGRGGRRLVEGQALLVVVLGAAVLVALSLPFAFPETGPPSAERPYLAHGRLVAGVLAPFALLYVRGIEVAVQPLPPRARGAAAWAVLLAVCAVAVASEALLLREVLGSAYNWYHLP